MQNDDADFSQHLKKVRIRRPADIIIEQISNLIARRIIKAGQKLPSERTLAERFDVGRGPVREALRRLEFFGIVKTSPQSGTVREALRRLEFFGIVKTSPQSGTVVENLSEHVLIGLISNILHADDMSPEMLIEVRGALEALSAKLAAERATPEQISAIENAHRHMKEQANAGAFTLEEDLLFHLKIAEATNNNLLRSLIALMGPDVLHFSHLHATYKNGRMHEAADEHEKILEVISTRQADQAEELMKSHISRSYEHFRTTGDLDGPRLHKETNGEPPKKRGRKPRTAENK